MSVKPQQVIHDFVMNYFFTRISHKLYRIFNYSFFLSKKDSFSRRCILDIKVLVAYDDRVFRELVSDIIKKEGYLPVEACDGQQASATAEERRLK